MSSVLKPWFSQNSSLQFPCFSLARQKLKEPILPDFESCRLLLAGVYCSTELIVFSLFSLQVLKGSLNPIY